MKEKVNVKELYKFKNSTLDGGITNENFLVEEHNKKYVVRLGNDIPEHLVSRSNELIVSKAASNAWSY